MITADQLILSVTYDDAVPLRTSSLPLKAFHSPSGGGRTASYPASRTFPFRRINTRHAFSSRTAFRNCCVDKQEAQVCVCKASRIITRGRGSGLMACGGPRRAVAQPL